MRRCASLTWHGGIGSLKPHCSRQLGTAVSAHAGPAVRGGQSQRPRSRLQLPRSSQPFAHALGLDDVAWLSLAGDAA